MENKKKPQRIICPDCKTGKDSYLIDENSPVCPYLECYDGYNCAYYQPVNVYEKQLTSESFSPTKE